MRAYLFKNIFLSGAWKQNQLIHVDASGFIESISSNTEIEKNVKVIEGPVLAGFINTHSHSFQYAMAGLAEKFDKKVDDFWTWRTLMYNLANTLEPDQVEHIAAMLYSEMLKQGYTHVVEFHYLHHDPNGKAYANLSEMGERLVAAADRVGIGITLIPIMYSLGGFSRKAETKQKRFLSIGLDEYQRLLEASKASVSRSSLATLGYGAHSLRAVDPDTVIDLIENYSSYGPFHLHIAEQLREVEDSQHFLGSRPVQWLADHIEISQNINLVHATHLDDSELFLLARSPANVVLCPSTEANLGDGIFRFDEFIQGGGAFSIGSDSQIGLSPMEELRWIEYQQRLLQNRRAIIYGEIGGGEQLYTKALNSGSQGAGIPIFKVGAPLNFIELNKEHPLIATSSNENLLDTLIYSGNHDMIASVFTYGIRRVQDGQNLSSNEVKEMFIKTIRKLKNR